MESEILDEIHRCSNAVQKTAVEQTVYLRASSVKKDYDLQKYKDDVLRELNTPSPSKQSGE